MFTFVNHVQYISLALSLHCPLSFIPVITITHVKVGIPLWSEVVEFNHIILMSFLSHLCKRYVVIYICHKDLKISTAYRVTNSILFHYLLLKTLFKLSFTVLFAIAKFIILSLRGWFPCIPTSLHSLYF
jgi:hypothetical protein